MAHAYCFAAAAMATPSLSLPCSLASDLRQPHHHSQCLRRGYQLHLHQQQQHYRSSGSAVCVAAAGEGGPASPLAGQDFGARDPFPAELASNFGENVLGNADTEHRILMPSRLTEVTGLAAKPFTTFADAEAAAAAALSRADATELLKRVVGWRLLPSDSDPSKLKLQGEWKVRGEDAAQQMLSRFNNLAEREGQPAPDARIEGGGMRVRVDLWTEACGTVTENDFIMAAKIDQLPLKDLLQKARFWA